MAAAPSMGFLFEAEPERGIALPVLPGIRRIVAPNPSAMTYWGTNTYLVDTPGGVLVLDPGPDDAAHAAAVLSQAGAPILGILLTHTHHDHWGALATLRAQTGAPVFAWHDPAIPGFVPDIVLRDGDLVLGWTSLHTPGHASDHLCFVRPDGTVFSGDHVMGWSSSVVGPPGGSMADYLASLNRMLARDDQIYLPGHGPAVPSPRPFVRALVAHRVMREQAIARTLTLSPQGVAVLTAQLYADVSPMLRRAAECNVTAHLLKLRDEGRAHETSEGWTRPPDALSSAQAVLLS